MNKTTPLAQRTQRTNNAKFVVVKHGRTREVFETKKGAERYQRTNGGEVKPL